MKRTLPFAILLLLLLMISVGCNNGNANSNPLDVQIPDDFNFSLCFGIEGMNDIDTYSDTFTKDLISDGTETISFSIPDEKMKEIYQVFLKNKIAELPDDINAYALETIGDTASSHTPADYYSLTFTLNGITKTIVCNDGGPWDAKKGPPNERKQLVQFVEFIREYIFSTEEYQNMSPSVGGYA